MAESPSLALSFLSSKSWLLITTMAPSHLLLPAATTSPSHRDPTLVSLLKGYLEQIPDQALSLPLPPTTLLRMRCLRSESADISGCHTLRLGFSSKDGVTPAAPRPS